MGMSSMKEETPMTLRIAMALVPLVTLAHGAASQPDPEIIAEREAAREAAATLLDATVSGIWIVRGAAVEVLAATPRDAPCRKEWRRLAARATEALWPYVTDWTTATAETATAAVGEAIAAIVADNAVGHAAEYQVLLDEMEDIGGSSAVRDLPTVEEQLSGLEAQETTDLSLELAEKLASSTALPYGEAIGCVERGGLTWEEWVEAEAAGELPVKPLPEQDEAVETLRQQSGVVV